MIAICMYSLQSVGKNKTLGPHARQTTALKKNANKKRYLSGIWVVNVNFRAVLVIFSEFQKWYGLSISYVNLNTKFGHN